jgi:hypothetical protein
MGFRIIRNAFSPQQFSPLFLFLKERILPVAWTILFAAMALLDFAACFPIWMDGWTDAGRKQQFSSHHHHHHHQLLLLQTKNSAEGDSNGTESCPATTEQHIVNHHPSSSSSSDNGYNKNQDADCGIISSFRTILLEGRWWKRLILRSLSALQQQHYQTTIGLLFCVLCVGESIRRARVARQTALDTAALDDFEQTLSGLYYSSTSAKHASASPTTSPTTIANQQQQQQQQPHGQQHPQSPIRKSIRVWTPVVSTLAGWWILLPWPLLIYAVLPHSAVDHMHNFFVSSSSLSFSITSSTSNDPSLATLWISRVSHWLYETILQYHDAVITWLWKVALPVKLLWVQPLQFISRLRLFSRWIRYVRYAGPLVRLLFKLQDQFWVFGKTWKTKWAAQSERAKRLASRSMFFQDIQRLESLTKLQTRLASLPSHFTFSNYMPNNNNSNSNSNHDDVTTPKTTTTTTTRASTRMHRQEGFLTAGTTASTASTSSSFSALPTIHSTDERDHGHDYTYDDDDDDKDHPHSNTTTAIATTPTKSLSSSAATSTPTRRGASSASTTPTRDSVAVLIAQKKQESQRLKRRLDHLKQNLRQSSRITTDLYDRLMALTQEVVTRTRNGWSNIVTQNDPMNNYLISPQTRFSVAWRLCVTFALLSELGRLVVSWQLSGTFELRYRDLTKRLLGLCQTKSRPFRKFLGKVVRLPHNHPWLDTCRQSSPSSQFSLTVAWWSEFAIDLIGFLDILVWFYTGELDATTGIVVPKPFFARCILPGTLVQVLDHPTVPQTIPNLLLYCIKAARAVGYSRVIRWGLAVYPALDLILLSPIFRYLFHPMNKDEYLNYTESLVTLPYGFTSNPSLLLRPGGRASSHNLFHQGGMTAGDHPDDDYTNREDDDDNNDEDGEHLGKYTSFLRPPSTELTNSYREVLHASISENDGYGLYY